MAYHTRPIHLSIDPVAIGALISGTGTTITEATSKTKALSLSTDGALRGAITHIGVKLSSAGGTVVVNIWEDQGRTVPVCSVTLTPVAIGGGSAIVYDEAVVSGPDGRPFGMDTNSPTFWWEAVGDATSAGKTGTLYVKAKAIR